VGRYGILGVRYHQLANNLMIQNFPLYKTVKVYIYLASISASSIYTVCGDIALCSVPLHKIMTTVSLTLASRISTQLQ